jgi:hypothetical protein
MCGRPSPRTAGAACARSVEDEAGIALRILDLARCAEPPASRSGA